MYPVRPFKTYYGVSSGPRYLGIAALIKHLAGFIDVFEESSPALLKQSALQ